MIEETRYAVVIIWFCLVPVTTPLKETLDLKTTLLEAKFVPCIHMHFKWVEEGIASYLKEDIYMKKTSSDAASILASRYRLVSKSLTISKIII